MDKTKEALRDVERILFANTLIVSLYDDGTYKLETRKDTYDLFNKPGELPFVRQLAELVRLPFKMLTDALVSCSSMPSDLGLLFLLKRTALLIAEHVQAELNNEPGETALCAGLAYMLIYKGTLAARGLRAKRVKSLLDRKSGKTFMTLPEAEAKDRNYYCTLTCSKFVFCVTFFRRCSGRHWQSTPWLQQCHLGSWFSDTPSSDRSPRDSTRPRLLQPSSDLPYAW
jgi:hypothetical protein